VRGDYEDAAEIVDFYDEYFAMLDMSAEFYLETVDRVFQRDLLAQGPTHVAGPAVGAEGHTAYRPTHGREGAGRYLRVGQTPAVQELCTGIRPGKKRHHLQPGVGHYGIFSGSRGERQIYPIVRNFILANQ
jgi:poly(3-hydroxybutyrate) depolymerase